MSFKKKTFRLSCKESLCRDSCKKTFVNKISADYQAFQVKKIRGKIPKILNSALPKEPKILNSALPKEPKILIIPIKND